MNHLRRAHTRAALSSFRSASMAQATDGNARDSWAKANSEIAYG